MIEQYLIEKLNNSDLQDVVYTQQPEEKPERFYTLEKTGGGFYNQISECTVIVKSNAPTLYESGLMNDALKRAFFDLVKYPEISRVYLNSDYNDTDPTTQQNRYAAVFVVTYYEGS